jgi:hypothetical protein
MSNAGQPERENRLRAVRQRRKELSVAPNRAECAEEAVALLQEERRVEGSLRVVTEPPIKP